MDSLTDIYLEKGRTSGDGMEQEDLGVKTEKRAAGTIPKNVEACNKQLSQSRPQLRRKDSTTIQESIHHCKTSISGTSTPLPPPGLYTFCMQPECRPLSLPPDMPKGELHLLKPRLVVRSTISEHKKNKPQKFVPFEPYPGAVNHMDPNASSLEPKILKKNKNDLDIGVLVNQVSNMRTQELDEASTSKQPSPSVENSEVKKLQEELSKIKEERDYFQSQFKFQTQVNSELKNLLVASVGEDLQIRVNVLTEDKLQLAKALLDTANNLTTHTEQIEYLAGQCEVWRSKFLASSVMVEELARWKADLTQKNQMLTESTKRLLDTTKQIREIQLEMLKNLKFLAKIRYLNLPAKDVVSLSAENLNIMQQMVLHTGVGIPENLQISSANSNPLCESEMYAVDALKFISQPLMATDEAIRALFGQTQRKFVTTYPNNPETHSTDTAVENGVVTNSDSKQLSKYS